MTAVTPFLWFDHGKVEEAVAFYTAVFKDARVIAQNPMTAEFELAGQRFMALAGGPKFTFNEAVSFFVSCKDQVEVDYYWDALVAGGGAEGQCGWLKDKFGLSWQIIPEALGKHLGDPDPGRRERAMQAMFRMRKIIVADLDHAGNG